MCSPSSAITPLWKAMISSWTRFSSTRTEPMRASRGSTLPNRLPTSTDMHDRRNPNLPEGEGRDEGEGGVIPPGSHRLKRHWKSTPAASLEPDSLGNSFFLSRDAGPAELHRSAPGSGIPISSVAWRIPFFALVFLFCALPLPLAAHDSPEHQVELLTSIMSSQGKSASLLVKRAIEFR